MRTYEKTHSWLTFFANLDRIPFNLWIMLGECQSKCEHIGDAPILPDTAKELYQLSLIKGAVATTAIEGNTLTEKEVKDYLEGNLRVSQSREYQVREVDNIIKACNDILDVIKSGSTPHLDVESIKTLNRRILDGLTVDSHVTPGELRKVSVG
ncbi:MAG: Fic family protein, partial [Desulfomonilaceae bacterium]